MYTHHYIGYAIETTTTTTTTTIIKGERTRVEKQMLGGGFRALYR
jgi:hypothetical protein